MPPTNGAPRWINVANEAMRFAKALALGMDVEAQDAGLRLDEAWIDANAIIKSGYLTMEYDRLQEYSMPDNYLPARWFGFAAACVDFAAWIRGGVGSYRRPADVPITQVGDLILSLKHMNWEAPVSVIVLEKDDPKAQIAWPTGHRPIYGLHQDRPDTPVGIQIYL
jgi:hypothetical protein